MFIIFIKIYYLYQNKEYLSYKSSLDFLLRCQEFIIDLPRKRWQKFEDDPKRKDLLLKICKRGNPNHHRIYLEPKKKAVEPEGLKFEVEIRKYQVQKFQHLLFENQIQEFENQVIEYFFKRWSQVLPIQDPSPYIHWILDFYRKKKTKKLSKAGLVTNYANFETIYYYKESIKREDFYRYLQFLSYSQTLQIQDIQFLNEQAFYLLKFNLSDFLTFIGTKDSHYAIQRLISFLHNIQDIRLLSMCFKENSFMGSTGIPNYKIYQEKHLWVIQFYLAVELYHYDYPFHFNQYFLTYQSHYECIVKLQIIEAFSQPSLIKEFHLKDLLNQHKRSGSQLLQIRKIALESFNHMRKKQMIQSRIALITKDDVKYYEGKGPFTLDIFLKADRIIFVETNSFNC